MQKGSTIGLILVVAGIVLLIIYGLYLGFEEILETLDIITGFLTGLIVVGILVLLLSIIFEQRRDTKKIQEEIKKEDMEP